MRLHQGMGSERGQLNRYWSEAGIWAPNQFWVLSGRLSPLKSPMRSELCSRSHRPSLSTYAAEVMGGAGARGPPPKEVETTNN